MSDRALRVLAAGVATAGVGVAGYLTWAHYGSGSVVCPVGGGCETVQESEYAEVAGVPVALLGLGAYVVLLALIVWDAPIARLAAAALSLIGLVFSTYLLVVQAFVIEAFCIWCLANDVVIAPALAVVTSLRLRS
ncbi:MAG: vitamin K epoxide reductase family protein [Gaiellaceae bacterium]